MPEPVTFLLGGVALLLTMTLISYNRFTRLRRHIDESASAVAAERRRRDRLVTALGQAPADVAVGAGGASPAALTAEVEEAEDRLAAVNRLHTAQVRTWNRLGQSGPWGRLRGLTGWRPMPDPDDEEPSAADGRPSA